MAHQAGLQDEGPGTPCLHDGGRNTRALPERELRENMVWCLECCAGREGAPYGVRLEDQVLLTRDGALPLMTYPFDPGLL